MKNKLSIALTLAVTLAMMVTSLALADPIANNIDSTVDPILEVRTITTGGSTTVGFYDVASNTDPSTDASGCNSTGSSPSTVTLDVPAGVTATPMSFDLVGCGTGAAVSVSFTSNTPGSYTIAIDGVSGGKDGSQWNTAPAEFTLVVNPAPPSDTTPPVITPNVSGTLGNNGWYVSDVTVSWSVVDNESSIISTSGCDTTTIMADTVGVTLTCTATSAGGTSSESVTIKRDATVPTLNPNVSPDPVLLNGSATATPNASDNLSGVASSSCDSVDTSSVGAHSVNCTAMDNAGNIASASASYTVNFNLCTLYDQAKSHKAGSTVPLKLQLCDVNGGNYSSSSIIVKAVSVTKLDDLASGPLDDSGSANSPDMNFRYDATLAGYIFNLSTKGLTTGSWKVMFTVDGMSASSYYVTFDIK